MLDAYPSEAPARDHGFLSGGGEMGARIAAFDWSATPLGRLDAWPQSLKSAVGLLLPSRQAMFLIWGPDLTLIYNDAYAAILGRKHPRALGRPFVEVWSEIRDEIQPLVASALAGDATWSENLQLVLERHGYSEDTWWSFSYSPLRDEAGVVRGMFCATSETTRQVQAERRLSFLLRLNELLRETSDPVEVTSIAARELAGFLGVSRVGYGEIDPTGETVFVARDWTRPGFASLAGERRPLDSFGPEIIAGLRTGRMLVLEDIAADPRSAPYAAGYASIDAGSMIIAPLIRDGLLTAILYLHEPQPRRWTEGDCALAGDVAARTWSAQTHARAEAALRESEQRLRLVQAAGQIGSFDWDMTTGAIHRSPEYLALQGLPAASPTDGHYSDAWMSRLHPDDRDRMVAAFEQDAAAPCTFEHEYRIIRPDTGETRWLNNRGRVEGDDQSRPVRLLSAQTDVTARKLAEAAILESESRFRAMADFAPAPVWVTTAEGSIAFVNQAFAEYAGAQAPELLGNVWLEMLHPEDIQGVVAQRAAARVTNAPYSFEARFRRGDKAWRMMLASAKPRFDGEGVFQGYVGLAIDVTEVRAAEAHQRLLINELNHRVKNTLATVQSIARQTLRVEVIGSEARELLNDRLLALSAAHDVLTRESWEGAELEEIVQAAARPYEAAGARRFRIEGPPTRVGPKVALAVSMALHELATNAAKYGSLSLPDGRVSVRWSFIEGDRVELEWRERDGPPVVPPTRRGFGSRLLQQGLATELGGAAQIAFEPDGVRCRMRIPSAVA